MKDPAPQPDVAAFAPLLGEWRLEVRHSSMEGQVVAGRATFEFLPGGHFLIQRSEADHPQFPDSIAIVGGDEFHYYDSRGVRRVYSSAVRDGVWTVHRESADPFSQRFVAPLGGDVIEARWDRSEDGGPWELDLSMLFTRPPR
jgi:hypothetical protein